MKNPVERNSINNSPSRRAPLLRTLIVEDDADFRQLLKEIMISHFPSMKIEEAASNKQAIKKIEQCAPQLIFMDTNMLEGSSLPAVKQIKKTHPETIIVALTLYNVKEYEDAALQSGADYFLAKSSLTGNEIVGLVQSLVSAIN